MNGELIVVRQPPVIEDQLRQVKADIEARVSNALSLVCTEETYRQVKKVRSDLNKERNELESRRKEVKAAILAPYERFEALYKECAGDIYATADAQLKKRIAEVESGLKQQRQDAVKTYFDEYRQSLGIDPDLVPFNRAGIKISLSESLKSLKGRAKDFLDRVAGDLALIATQDFKDEILVEYRATLNISAAVTAVSERHKAIEAARQQREVAQAQQAEKDAARMEVEAVVAETIQAPAIAPPPANPAPEPSEEKMYSTAFRVTGTLSELRALKKFLTEGGYSYEQL